MAMDRPPRRRAYLPRRVRGGMGLAEDGGPTMTILDSAELPLESGTEAHSTAKFTEEQARQWLAERGDSSVRQLAKLWGWHPSKVQRCLSRVRSETPRDTVSETPTVSADTPDTPETPQGQGRVLGRTPSGTIAAAM